MEKENWKDTDWYKEIERNHKDCFFNQYWIKTIIRDKRISDKSKYEFLDYLIDESTKYGYSQSNDNPRTILGENVKLIPSELRNKAAKMQMEMYKTGEYSIHPSDLEKIFKDKNLSDILRHQAKILHAKSASIELIRKEQSKELTLQVINSAIHRMNNKQQ